MKSQVQMLQMSADKMSKGEIVDEESSTNASDESADKQCFQPGFSRTRKPGFKIRKTGF